MPGGQTDHHNEVTAAMLMLAGDWMPRMAPHIWFEHLKQRISAMLSNYP